MFVHSHLREHIAWRTTYALQFEEGRMTPNEKKRRARLELAAFGDITTILDGVQLSEPELWWSKHYGWLKDNGYTYTLTALRSGLDAVLARDK